MAKITYLDPNDDAPKVTWLDVLFRAHVPTEVRDPRLIKLARTHPHFEVAEEEPAEQTVPGKATWPDEEEQPAKKGKR